MHPSFNGRLAARRRPASPSFPFGSTPYKFDVICRTRPDPTAGTRVINNLQIGRALTGEMPLDPPIMSMMCWNSNPVTQAPETDKIVAGLKFERTCSCVSAEHFISDTASSRGYFIACLYGCGNGGHDYFRGATSTSHTTPNAPYTPGEAIPNNEMFRQLATQIRIIWKKTPGGLIQSALSTTLIGRVPACDGIDLEYLSQKWLRAA